ncbi:hypothetical protein BWQ96_04725 [Gracilariopsis chorda]|uniref:Uncharacterized protein n=1 Tax=Gracilariopsis chorda TaxID=448386 RepID=A0A2V3ITS4_9FLOR|nr:hypothetical protein BWQ96_04725 [Gracilariopsis chorda]|eukprot:PXF45523.1 hypothetical protein BWQ96_04725 [Gracilariopsis chorda]
MVATKILDEALRGGEPARALEQRCLASLHRAESEVKEALSSAPAFIAESKSKHILLLTNADEVNAMIEMLGESLDEITKRTQQMNERSRLDSLRKEALDDLSAELVPFVKVAEALQVSDSISEASFPELQLSITQLHRTAALASESGYSQLVRMITELHERADEATAMMKARYMDTYEVRPNSIIARGHRASSPSINIATADASSTALAEAGMLDDAIQGIVSELVRNQVASGLAQATVCFESRSDLNYVLEWSSGVDDSAELLEFDLDDLETVSEDDIDIMTQHLDISNAAARALRIYDVFRDHVVGPDFSRQLAVAMQPWFIDHVLPSSIITSSSRPSKHGSVPREMLRSRVMTVSACARVIQEAVRARGATSFKLRLDIDCLEGTIGAECRAQAVLTARKAIGTFADARHDDHEMVECPLSATRYIPLSERRQDYFPPCLVTRAALTVQDMFLSTRMDAVKAHKSGSPTIGSALNAASIECLRAYREDVPVQHNSELRASLRLKALYYNDCLMLAHSCRRSHKETGFQEDLDVQKRSLEEAANKVMMIVRRTAEQRLVENLNAACRNGALGAYGTLTRIQRSSALSGAYNAMREVVHVFSEIVPTELAEIAASTLLQKYLVILMKEVVALSEISADGCEQIDGILEDADNNVNTLMDNVKSMETLRGNASPPNIVVQLRSSQQRLSAIREILNARMEDIVRAYRTGKYNAIISRQEVEHFVKAIFEDTPLRSGFIADLDMSLEQESQEWENSNW